MDEAVLEELIVEALAYMDEKYPGSRRASRIGGRARISIRFRGMNGWVHPRFIFRRRNESGARRKRLHPATNVACYMCSR